MRQVAGKQRESLEFVDKTDGMGLGSTNKLVAYLQCATPHERWLSVQQQSTRLTSLLARPSKYLGPRRHYGKQSGPDGLGPSNVELLKRADLNDGWPKLIHPKRDQRCLIHWQVERIAA